MSERPTPDHPADQPADGESIKAHASDGPGGAISSATSDESPAPRTVTGWSLSEDGLTLVIEWVSRGHIGASTWRWDTPASVERIEGAIASAKSGYDQPRQGTVIRSGASIPLPGRRTAHVAFSRGAPTWWVPKVEVKSGKVVVGWLRHSVGVMVSAPLDPTAALDETRRPPTPPPADYYA